MKKFWTYLWKEEFPQTMGLIFVALAILATLVVLTAPIVLPEPARTLYYATQDPVKNLMFILACAVGGTVALTLMFVLVMLVLEITMRSILADWQARHRQ